MIFKNFFLKKLSDEIESIVSRRIKEDRIAQKEYALQINFPIGTKVILVGNEPGPLTVAEVFGYERLTIAKELDIVYIIPATGKQFYSFTSPIYWTQEREDALNKLTWDERYNVTTRFSGIDKEDAARKNTPEYQNRLKSFL